MFCWLFEQCRRSCKKMFASSDNSSPINLSTNLLKNLSVKQNTIAIFDIDYTMFIADINDEFVFLENQEDFPHLTRIIDYWDYDF